MPSFFALAEVVGRAPPPHAATLVPGTWRGSDADGDICRLRFNKFGMASVEFPNRTQKGPVLFAADTMEVAPVPLPLLGYFSSTLQLHVRKWPTSAEPELIVEVPGEGEGGAGGGPVTFRPE